jgi:hypothetical protein
MPANEDDMSENNDSQQSSISKGRSLEEVADYWDSHSLADHWEQTYEVEFEIRARHRITLEPEVYARLEEPSADPRGVISDARQLVADRTIVV